MGWGEPNQQQQSRQLESPHQLETNDWPKFQEQQKNLHSAKIYQTEPQTKLEKLTPILLHK